MEKVILTHSSSLGSFRKLFTLFFRKGPNIDFFYKEDDDLFFFEEKVYREWFEVKGDGLYPSYDLGIYLNGIPQGWIYKNYGNTYYGVDRNLDVFHYDKGKKNGLYVGFSGNLIHSAEFYKDGKQNGIEITYRFTADDVYENDIWKTFPISTVRFFENGVNSDILFKYFYLIDAVKLVYSKYKIYFGDDLDNEYKAIYLDNVKISESYYDRGNFGEVFSVNYIGTAQNQVPVLRRGMGDRKINRGYE